MMSALFVGGWGIGEIAVAVVLVLAIVACVVAYCRHAGVAIPPLLVNIFWIVVGAVIVIAAIRFLMSM